ncbi:CC_3452 family protein [Tsuneonella suprasediminis]|nr:hypothetical protein [Tsuneonella suprasediminis]
MNLSLSQSARPIAIVAALGWTALTFGTALAPSPAQAAQGPFYQAELASAAGNNVVVAGGVAWHCAETACTADRATSRPEIVCARLAKKAGDVTSFSADGKALDEAKLARCNGN